MAGGIGSRFWPKSRKQFPKQYLNLYGTNTMIQDAAERFRQILDKDRILIITTKDQKSILLSQIPWLPPENILYEPMGKNTAPAIGLSAVHIIKRNADAKMIVAPADHLIQKKEQYLKVFKRGISLLDEFPNSLLTIGIAPTYPATGYGYIQKGQQIDTNGIHISKVKAFAEKPSLDVAQKFYESGEFVWNSGTFMWRADTILKKIDDLMPDLYDSLLKIKSAIGTPNADQVTANVYKEIFTESIDYGIMEHASNVFVLEGTFGWNDLGSWEEVYKIAKKDKNGNVIHGDPVIKNVENSYIETSDRTVALVGVKDLIVVDTPDALLICNKENSQDVKWVVERLKQNGQEKVI
jgi:mannose-1-phosphate guanylyltransferase